MEKVGHFLIGCLTIAAGSLFAYYSIYYIGYTTGIYLLDLPIPTCRFDKICVFCFGLLNLFLALGVIIIIHSTGLFKFIENIGGKVISAMRIK